ncbi:hypothetical protein N7478_000865 [Penicillium angulare]|uniref:uncharacterized protein n=1 Tax=Penicillium angulare TaxID=116970 RepID=UPI002541BCFC|nr:uncharacterized protein N7478_000865 [Penicillium angulare]KAJ5291614.1 hypothetical protein N7478_000865 [Penicillium angulare]
MLAKHFFFAIAVVGSAFASVNSEQAVADIHELTRMTKIAKRSLEDYNGGIPGAYRIARSVYNAHTSAETARKSMGNSDPLADDDSGRTLDAYNQFYPVLLDTLQVAKTKAPELKKTGLSYPAQGMMANLYNEKTNFETVMHGRLSNNHSRMVQPSTEKVDRAFKDTLDALKN